MGWTLEVYRTVGQPNGAEERFLWRGLSKVAVDEILASEEADAARHGERITFDFYEEEETIG